MMVAIVQVITLEVAAYEGNALKCKCVEPILRTLPKKKLSNYFCSARSFRSLLSRFFAFAL